MEGPHDSQPLGVQNVPWLTASEETGVSAQQPQRNESCQQLVNLEEDPKPQTRTLAPALLTPLFLLGEILSRDFSYAGPRLLTYRNCEIISLCHF